MEHYVIVNEWATDGIECNSAILGVTHTLEEAKEVFSHYIKDEKEYAIEHGWEIYDDCETVFDAGEDGCYVGNHTHLYIEMVKNNLRWSKY